MSANNISGVAADIEAGGLATLDARQDISLLNGTEQDKNDSYSTSAQRDSHSERSTSIGSRLDADRIEMQAGNDITLTNASVNAKTGIELGAGNNIAFNAVKNTNVSDFTDHNGINNSGRRVDVGTQLHNQSGEVRITAGNNVTGTVTQIINETGNTIIGAGNDVIFNEGRDETSSEGTRSWTKKRWYGKKTYTEHESKFSDTAVTSNITGDNVVISSNKGNVSLIGANVNAAQAAEVTAMKGAVTVQSAVDKSAKNTNRTTSNFYKGTGQQKGYERETLNETGISGGSVYINGQNVDVNAASLQARDGNLQIGDATLATDAQGNLQLDSNGKPIIESGSIDNLTFGTIELDSREWDEKQKAYKGIAKVGMQVAGVVGGALGITDSITISESSGTTTTSKDEAVSRLEGQNILVGGKTVTANGTQFTTTQAGGSTYVLGNDIDLGVATSTSTTTETAQKEVIGGEGVKLNSDSLQLGAVVRTDTEDTKTTTTGTNQGVTINSDNIVVLGDMTDGSLTTTAAKLNANQQTGSLLIGAKTTVLGGIEDTETVTQSNKTDTTRISVDVHHAAVDTISAAEQVKEAGSALAAAKNNLRDAKDRVSRGELSQDAIKDYEINLAAATLNLANAQINLGSVAAGAANTAGTLGFSASANVENTQTKTTDTQTQGKWQGTEVNGANATFVGDNFTGVGLQGNIGQLNIDNLGSLNLSAGTNTSSSTSTSKTNSQTGSISTTGSASLGISTQQSQSQAQGTTFTNSELNVGELNGYADTTNLTGGRINANGGSYATDNLYIETVQNSESQSNKSSGGNLGINFNNGIPSGGSIGANKASGSSQSITAAEQSGIVYNDDNHSLTAGSTTNIGGIIANINTDSDGTQTNSNLNFTTGTLVTKDLINTATQEQKSIGGSLSIGSTATGKSLNNVGLQLGNTGQEFESKTLATIGQGAIVTGDALTGNDSLAGVNRDALNTEIIIKDIQTGGLDIDAGIDARVFTSAGREEIVKEQRELGKNVKGVVAITGTAGLAVPSIAAGLLDNGNSNPDSLNKSGIDKAKDNVTQLVNNLETGMSDDTVNLTATVEAIQEGELTNSVDNKDTLNQLNAAITQGTDASGTQISLVDDLRNVNGDSVRGTTNVINGTDTYIATDSMGNVVELINHEGAHQNGQGEFAADVMGQTGNSAFNLGKWANSGAIAEERTTITPRPITATNDAKAQQEQLANDKEKLETQQNAGDAFEDNRRGITVRSPQQQQRRDIIAFETLAIRRHLPNFRGISTARPNNQISQAEVLEYQALSRFLQSSGRTYPNPEAAYRAFQRETAQRPVQLNIELGGSGGQRTNSSSNPDANAWEAIRPNVQNPNKRHKVDSVGGKNVLVRDVNTVVSSRVNMEHDIIQIRLGGGQPSRGPSGERQIEINGRTYQTHAGGGPNTSDSLIPVSSRNPNEMFRLSRGEYKNLQQIVRNKGNINQTRTNLSGRPDFNQNDFNRAAEVYNATR